MFKQFDMVQLITTKNITYRSGPPHANVSPHGSWSVIGNIGEELILSKDATVIKVPYQDVRKVASYDIDKLLGASNGKKDQG